MRLLKSAAAAMTVAAAVFYMRASSRRGLAPHRKLVNATLVRFGSSLSAPRTPKRTSAATASV
jgi:hypothetical protein